MLLDIASLQSRHHMVSQAVGDVIYNGLDNGGNPKKTPNKQIGKLRERSKLTWFQ